MTILQHLFTDLYWKSFEKFNIYSWIGAYIDRVFLSQTVSILAKVSKCCYDMKLNFPLSDCYDVYDYYIYRYTKVKTGRYQLCPSSYPEYIKSSSKDIKW